MKLLLCAACLCCAGAFVNTAMTQEKKIDSLDSPIDEDSFVDEEPADRPAGLAPAVEDAFYGGRVGGRNDVDIRTPLGSALGGGGGSPFGGGGTAAGRMESDTPLRRRIVRRTIAETRMEPIPPEELEAMQKLQTAIQQLKSGRDDAARKAATETIQQQLTTQFEADLKQREKELAEVEQRVKTLREQLDKRKAAQADIVNLRMQTLINDANGLGFPDAGFASGDPMLQEAPPERLERRFLPREPDERAFQSDLAPAFQPATPRAKPPE